jgi:hypothetical protein
VRENETSGKIKGMKAVEEMDIMKDRIWGEILMIHITENLYLYGQTNGFKPQIYTSGTHAVQRSKEHV